MKNLAVVRHPGNDKRKIAVYMDFPEEKFKNKEYTLDTLKKSIYEIYFNSTDKNEYDAI